MDRTHYGGLLEAETMLKGYLNVSTRNKVLDTLLYKEVAGKLLSDPTYNQASLIDGGPAVSEAVPTLHGVYTQRLTDIATQDSVSDSRHPDYNLYTALRSAAVAGYVQTHGGEAPAALQTLRDAFDAGTLLGVQYRANPAQYLAQLSGEESGGADLIKEALGNVSGTTMPALALGLRSIAGSTTAVANVGLSADVFYLASQSKSE